MSDKARDARDEEEDREGPDEDESDDWGGNSPGSLTICRCFIQVGFGQGGFFWKQNARHICVFSSSTLCAMFVRLLCKRCNIVFFGRWVWHLASSDKLDILVFILKNFTLFGMVWKKPCWRLVWDIVFDFG